MKTRARSSAGFTLVEVLIALAMLSVVLLAAAASTTKYLGVITRNRMRIQAAAVADAQIAITDRETNQVRGTRTSASGDYAVVGLQPGTYEVRVQRVGFSPANREVRLLVGQRATISKGFGG